MLRIKVKNIKKSTAVNLHFFDVEERRYPVPLGRGSSLRCDNGYPSVETALQAKKDGKFA